MAFLHRFAGITRRTTPRLRQGAAALLMFAAACQDLPTAAIQAESRPAATAGGLHVGQVAFTCTLSRTRPRFAGAIWEQRQEVLFFSRSEVGEGARLVQYRLRRDAPDGTLAFAADCLVPYTEAALRRVDRRFPVSAGGAAEQYRERQGRITIMGCVQTEAGCLLEPITVTAQPGEEDSPDPCDIDPSYCDGGAGAGGDDGGGGGWAPGGGLPGDSDNDGDTLDDGPGAFAACIVAKLGVGGWAAIAGTAYSAYQVWDARSSTREAERRYNEYINSSAPQDSDVALLYYRMWQDAKNNESNLYTQLAVTSGIAASELFKAALACSAAALLPTA